MKSLAVACLLGAVTPVSTDWNYISNGSDWGGQCGESGGSPINISTEDGKYKEYDIERDNLTQQFSNLSPATIKWENWTTQVELNGANIFKSDLGKNVFQAHTADWEGKFFCFHHQSAHTVNGVRNDLEMMTYFDADPKKDELTYKHAAISVMFSVNDYNVKLSRAEEILIDTFFETLDWSKTDPTVNLVTFGDFMNMVNMNNRWIYAGSMTIPPCTKAVYWNVLHAVYPIKKRHLDLFKTKMADARLPSDNQKNAFTNGNYRATQPYVEEEHGLAVVTETTLGSERDSANDINYNININIYNQNVGGQC